MAWAAVATRVRADARRWWAAWLALGLLVGLAGGTVMASAAGARRTDSAFARLLDETNAPDALVNIRCAGLQLVGECPSPAEAVSAFRGHPGVLDAAAFVRVFAPLTDSRDQVLQPFDACYGGTGGLTILAPLDDRVGRDILGVRLVEGRMPDDARADEAVLSPIVAEQHGIEVGDRIRAYTQAQDCGDPRTWRDPLEITVVGIGLNALDVPPKSGGFYTQSVHATPAFADAIADNEFGLVLQLEEGVTAGDLVDAEGLPEFTVQTEVPEDVTRPIETGTGSDANALWMLALVAAVASACVVGPATGRHRRAVARDDAPLAAIGWSRRERLLRGAAHALAIWLVAVTVALIMGLVASAQMPIGDARAIEPTSHIAIDLPVFAVGSAALVAALALGLVRSGPPRRSQQLERRRAPVAGLAADAGMRPVAVMGIRVGIEPSSRDVPVRSSLVAVGLGVATVVGVLVFTASAQRLRETPADRGMVWDDIVTLDEEVDGIELTERVRSWPEVEAAGYALYGPYVLQLGPEARRSYVVAFDADPEAIEPRVFTGRAPVGDGELLVNPRLAADLHLRIGDRVEAAVVRDGLSPEDRNALTGARTRSFELVGTGAVPIGGGAFATGAAMTLDGYLSLLPADHEAVVTPRPDHLLIDRRPGASGNRIAARLDEVGVTYDPDLFDPDVVLEDLVSVDRTTTESIPDLLGLLMVTTSAGVLLYGLAIAIGGSRRDLAVARALGFDRRLVLQTARWVGLTQVVAVLCLALPAGILVGRAAWSAYTSTLGVVAVDRVPPVELSVLVLACTGVGIAASWCVGRVHLRRPPGAVLRDQ